MSVSSKIDRIYRNALRIEMNKNSKFVIMSDCHRGNGGSADIFIKNENIYYHALQEYFRKGFTYIELGDGDELWENKKFSSITMAHHNTLKLIRKFNLQDRFQMIYGNHDIVKRSKKWSSENLGTFYNETLHKTEPLFPDLRVHEAVVLQESLSNRELLLLHGHQADFLNDNLWRLSRLLVRYLWRPLQLIGAQAPFSARNDFKKIGKIGNLLEQWAADQEKILIAGHTHRSVFPQPGEGLYFNDGCCVNPHYITAIELVHDTISLIIWSVKTQEDGTLYVKREVLDNSQPISAYFAQPL